MDDISKIPRLPGDGAQDDTQFKETIETKHFGSYRSTSNQCSLNDTQFIEGLKCRFFCANKFGN